MGMLRKLIRLLLRLVPFALAVALVLIFSPESLMDIEGRNVPGPAGESQLLRKARAAMAAGEAFECTEAELNAHLQSVIVAREAPAFEVFADLKGVWVRLQEGRFELVFERDFLGLGSTVAARLVIDRADGEFRIDALGGRFGLLPVPRGALNLIRGGIENFGGVLGEEKDVLSRSGGITISSRRMRLEPRGSSRS